MPYEYSLYGLRLDSARPLPGVHPRLPGLAPDLFLHWPDDGDVPPAGLCWVNAWKRQVGSIGWFELRRSDADTGTLEQFVLDLGRFAFEVTLGAGGRDAWVRPLVPMPDNDLCAFFLGPLMGCILRRRGAISLHASVVAVGDRGIVLVGPKGAGKSTTAAALASQGAAILSDDLAVLTRDADGGFLAHPGYPGVRLWPASADALYGDSEKLPSVLSFTDKRHLELSEGGDAGRRFRADPVHVERVVLLAEREADRGSTDIVPVPPGEAFVHLNANATAQCALDDAGRTRDFATFAELVRMVPVRRAHRQNRLDALPELARAIIGDQKLRP